MKIENKIVLITGANRGIGRALVDAALSHGASRVYAASRQPFHHSDQRVVSLTLDVTNPTSIARAADAVEELDLLINNAGVAPFDDLSGVEAIELALAVNLYGVARVSQAFLPALKRSGGAIVNNLSLVALAPVPMIPAYSLSKAAALSLTQSMRALLAQDGVSVHGALIGPTDTDMNRGFDIPKAAPAVTAYGILDGLARGEEEIFPDPAAQLAAAGWRGGVAKALERQFAGFLPAPAAA